MLHFGLGWSKVVPDFATDESCDRYFGLGPRLFILDFWTKNNNVK